MGSPFQVFRNKYLKYFIKLFLIILEYLFTLPYFKRFRWLFFIIQLTKTILVKLNERTQEMNKPTYKHIDSHCHVFNKDVLSMGIRIILGSLQIGEIARLLDISNIDKLLNKIENIIHFIDIGLNNNTEGIFDEMQEVYDNKFVLTPLMLDLTYVSGANKTIVNKTFNSSNKEHLHYHLNNTLKDYSEKLKQQQAKSSASDKRTADKKIVQLENKLKELKIKFDQYSKLQSNIRLFGKYNFEKQLIHLKKLKHHHKNIVYPFLSVDPRNKEILNIVKREVGPGKDFIGIKLYAPCGYSPTDPVLYGTSHNYSPNEDCLFNYCIQNDIPITAHNSDSGFATFTNSVKINGYIYNPNIDDIEYVNDRVIFKKKIDILRFHFDEGWIQERAMILNHPKIWNQVLNKFKGLRLNLAHFGGSEQLHNLIKYFQGKNVAYNSYSWALTIFNMLQNPEYKNFYTDLSCFKESDKNIKDPMTLKLFKQKIYDSNPNIHNNILYGSDYYLNMIFTDSFEGYLDMFLKAFGKDFERISITNNKQFLNFI